MYICICIYMHQAARDDAFGTDSKASPFDGIKEQT